MRIGFAMCGSFCTFAAAFSALEQLAEQYDDIFPIMSEISQSADTRFGTAQEHIERITRLCGKAPAASIVQAEPIGPKALLDLLIIAPCTGNTLSKMAQGITDSTVTMAANIASAARRRAVHFVCICKTPFVTVATAGVFPWWQRKRQQHRGARSPFVAGQLPIPTHLTRCSYSVQCIAQIPVCIIAHAARLCKPQKEDARVGVLFCLMSYFFSRVRRRVSSSTSPSTSS